MNSFEDETGRNGPATGRFALLRHDWPEPHRDLVLQRPGEESREQLMTWALYAQEPEKNVFRADRITIGRAVPLEPHRAIYLCYEGPVSGGRGSVSRECGGLVVSDENDKLWVFKLRVGRPGGWFDGRLRIERAAIGHYALAIRVSSRHESAAAGGFVFVWEPARSSAMRIDNS